MALRRCAQLLGPRLAQWNQALPACSVSGSSSLQHLGDAFDQAQTTGFRGFASDALTGATTTPTGTLVARDDGLPPTVYAIKNPSPDITYDEHTHERFIPGDPSKRAFTYFVLTGGRFIYASAIRVAVLKFILSMTATADVLAMASLEVDLSKIDMGQTITVKWRGKPVFIRRRTEEDIKAAVDTPMSELRDPESDEDRRTNPEWLVVVGVCTHLGCVPLPGAGDWNGWFCPCHGSHYDTSGRARKGPAPSNLEVPEYKFIDENTLLVG
ncbi:hypothetical protein WJX73_005956 [Symbiochloris irregularis]|uniref:Cytochrome b-c1 complex subunit Rieske, mitochondrial n=1 Tax=Symbiochloris irregularis TaxID=706552 RepID=A0AAW1PBF9_9CHLO